jgi:hypothetical protein
MDLLQTGRIHQWMTEGDLGMTVTEGHVLLGTGDHHDEARLLVDIE